MTIENRLNKSHCECVDDKMKSGIFKMNETFSFKTNIVHFTSQTLKCCLGILELLLPKMAFRSINDVHQNSNVKHLYIL